MRAPFRCGVPKWGTMKATRWRTAIVVALGLTLSLPLSLLGPLRPLSALALTWDASVDTSHVPTLWYTQTSPSFDVTVTNTGTATWPAGGPNPVHVDLYFSNENRDGACCPRYALPNDIAPNASVTIHASKTAPYDVGSYTLDINLVKENEFWFETQTPNLPVGVSVQAKVACGAYCTVVTNSGPTHYWRLNDRTGGGGAYRDVLGGMDQGIISGMFGTVSDVKPPADADAGAASIHTTPTFQIEPSNNGQNVPVGATIPNWQQSPPFYSVGGWVKQDGDQPGHSSCFLEGSPVNGDAWLCRDVNGYLSFRLNVVCANHDHFFLSYGNPLLDDGRWHYVLGRYTDGPPAEGELWVDGVLVGSAAKPVPAECAGQPQPVQGIREIYIGQNFHGYFSEVAYWQNPLAASSIGPLASVPVGGAFCLIKCWDFNLQAGEASIWTGCCGFRIPDPYVGWHNLPAGERSPYRACAASGGPIGGSGSVGYDPATDTFNSADVEGSVHAGGGLQIGVMHRDAYTNF
jgi:hypothetical protein